MVDSEAAITEDTTGAAELQSSGSTDRYPSRSRRTPEQFDVGVSHW